MLFIVAILWGSSYVFAKLTVEAGMHSGLINACRGTMCALAGGLIFFKKIRHMTWVDFRLGLVIGTITSWATTCRPMLSATRPQRRTPS